MDAFIVGMFLIDEILRGNDIPLELPYNLRSKFEKLINI